MIATFKHAPGKLISLGFLAFGIIALMQVVLPIVRFQLWMLGQKYNHQLLISPMQNIDSPVLGISVENKDNFPIFTSSLKRLTIPNYDSFTLSIPSIKIDKAQVLVDTNDLSKTLAHLPGSALPGEKGNMFISGHSALSQFFDLKEAVFSRLLDLKKGDQMIVQTPGSQFIYEVVDFKIVSPTDLSVISPPDDQGRYVSLMTCVPPGLNFKRLVVLGKML